MPSFKVAHVKEQGVNLIIVPLDSSFGHKMSSDQHTIINEIETAAHSAGLTGTVVPVWLNSGRAQFIAPRNWHSFFQGLSWNQVIDSLNKTLSW